MRWKNAWLLNGALVLGASMLALCLAEGTVRVLSPQPIGLSHQDRYGLAMHWPGITRFLRQYGHEVSINSAGMRDREHTEEKPAGVFRILVLGDSFMEALQVPFEMSLPNLLERTLPGQTGKRVEVINAGVSGWGQGDELRYLTHYGLEYRPDLVLIAMTLHNDISDNLREEWFTLRGNKLVEQPRTPIPFLRFKELELKALLATHLQFFQLYRRFRHGSEIDRAAAQLNRHVVELFEVTTPTEIARGLDLTAHLLAEIQRVSAGNGARVALTLLPIRYQLSDSEFEQFVRSAGVDLQRVQIDKPQRVISQVADRLGIPVIDLLPEFRSRVAGNSTPLYLEWDGHWNDTGHRLASEVVVAELVRSQALR